MVTGSTVQTQRSAVTGTRGWVAGDGTWAQCLRAGALFALCLQTPVPAQDSAGVVLGQYSAGWLVCPCPSLPSFMSHPTHLY